MERDLVSIIIPVYNRPHMLRDAVASALAQTYRPIEVIVVDDGSTDETPRVAEDLAAVHPEVRVIRQANGGVGSAREAGRLVARGEFMQHLDSDDLLLPGKLELQVRALREQPDCDVAYGWTRFRHGNGDIEPRPWKRSGESLERMFPAMLEDRWWDTPTPLYRRALTDRVGPWTSLRIEEDWEYDCRVAALGPRLAYCEEWMCEVRAHGSGQLSGRGLIPDVLRDRSRAHEMILAHALRAGLSPELPEMRHFARELFLLARQCGATGLASESQRLIQLAKSVSDARDMRVYELVARAIGWTRAGKLATFSDKLR